MEEPPKGDYHGSLGDSTESGAGSVSLEWCGQAACKHGIISGLLSTTTVPIHILCQKKGVYLIQVTGTLILFSLVPGPPAL